MYFPFLRGKQFELIALRELSEFLSEEVSNISPIIEPVKGSYSTLNKTLEILIEEDINFNIIINPVVGDLVNKSSEIIKLIENTFAEYSNFQIGIYINSEKSVRENLIAAKEIKFNFNGFSFIHAIPLDDVSILKEFDKLNKTNFNIIHFGHTSRRYHRNFPAKTRVSLDDYFNILSKNSDYLLTPDEPFTEEHLYFREDGFEGFSDYLTVGENYSESGFLPYAVVIHLTYSDSLNKIRVHHFVSDTNDDTSDIAGKFAEALKKLMSWIKESEIAETQAIKEFKELYRTKHFPGLGYLKKLSIMHHIELITKIIAS